MKQLMVIGVVLSSWASPAVMADCSTTPLDNGALLALIPGKTVCAKLGTEQWQEQHITGGVLVDYKKGPSDPVDPSVPVGTWGIASDIVTYTYGSTSYGYTVHAEGGAFYTFCGVTGGAPVIPNAEIVGTASCP